MTILEHWQAQKETLRTRIQDAPAVADVVYQVRHALLQTEQNALAEMSDDVLRQQSGVLFSCVKTSVGLMEAHLSSQVWIPQKQPCTKSKALFPALISALALLLLMLYFQWKGLVLGTLLSICALIAGSFAILRRPVTAAFQPDEARVTLRPDTERLFSILDGQMRSIDRYINDFSYLNEQLRSGSSPTDDASLAHAADLLEALYECDEEERAPAEAAALRLLSSMGLCAVNYCSENSRLFNTLPSKTTTRTLSPAILSMQDQRLLRRGTAAVQTGAA